MFYSQSSSAENVRDTRCIKPSTGSASRNRFRRSPTHCASNYHLKELARVGLVTPAGERRKGNFIEQLYQAVARRFVVSSRFTWNQERLEATLRDQVALAQLTELGERLQRDAARLIDAAMMDGTEIPSVSAVAEVRFENETARARFLEEYMDALQKLLNKHGGTKGEAFRVTFAAYPELEDA